MNESDYSIKPLQSFPNITGLNPATSSEEQKKRQNARQRPEKKDEPIEDQINALAEIVDEAVQNDTDNPHIDYCA